MDASNARYRFGALSRVNVEAIGVPGQRTFRLVLESGPASASLWLEKEQLYQLAIYIQEIISSLSGGEGEEREAPEASLDWGNYQRGVQDWEVGTWTRQFQQMFLVFSS